MPMVYEKGKVVTDRTTKVQQMKYKTFDCDHVKDYRFADRSLFYCYKCGCVVRDESRIGHD